MKAIKNTQIELDIQEITVLQQAISILKNVNKIINYADTKDVIINTNVDLYDTIYDEINKIESYIEY